MGSFHGELLNNQMVTLLTIGEFNYMTTRIMYFQNVSKNS